MTTAEVNRLTDASSTVILHLDKRNVVKRDQGIKLSVPLELDNILEGDAIAPLSKESTSNVERNRLRFNSCFG